MRRTSIDGEVVVSGRTRAVSRPVHLGLLHVFELWDGLSVDGPVELPLSSQRLVAFLALAERPLRRSYVAGALWEESSEERAAASLRSALWRLRQPGVALVECTPATVRLSPAVDVDVVESCAVAERLAAGEPVGNLRELIARFEQDLLADWYDDWVLLWRERWRQIRLHALEQVARRLTAEASYGAAVDAGLAAVRAEPLRETAHVVLIEAHLAEGNRTEALREYQAYADLLWRDLHIEPSPSIESLAKRLTSR